MLDNEITQNMLDLNHDMVLEVSDVLKTLDLNALDTSAGFQVHQAQEKLEASVLQWLRWSRVVI